MAKKETEKKEQVIPGDITRAEIEAWKALHGKVYKTMAGEQRAFIYRPIKRHEYTKLMLDTELTPEEEPLAEKRLKRLSDRQIGICMICTLWPSQEEMERMLENEAGLASNLSNEIMDHSGFDALAKSEEL